MLLLLHARKKKNGSVGQKNIFFFILFFFLDLNNSNVYFDSQYAMPTYILCLYTCRIKETKITVYEISAFYQFLGCFVNIFWKIREKSLQSRVSGYSKHNYFFFPPNSDKKKKYGSAIFS